MEQKHGTKQRQQQQPRCLGGEVTFPSPPMAVELLARDARASVPCPRPSERVGLAQVARRASDPLAPRSAWSLAGNSRHAVGAACVLVLTSMSSARPFHRKVRPLTAVAPCAARICMLSKAHMLISHRPPAPHRSSEPRPLNPPVSAAGELLPEMQSNGLLQQPPARDRAF